MLVKADYKDKNNSVYKCDKCNNTILELHRVIVNNHTYHLCKRCNEILKKWIIVLKT